MNKPELSARIATETSLSTASVDAAVTAVLSAIDDALASGETSRIAGFGTSSIRSRPARHGRIPRARARASPSTPPRHLPSRSARPSARPPTFGFGEREYRCRTEPMRRGMNGRGKSSGYLSAPPVCCRSSDKPIQRAIRSRNNLTARTFVAHVTERTDGLQHTTYTSRSGAAPNPNCSAASDEHRQEVQSRCRRNISRAKMCVMAARRTD